MSRLPRGQLLALRNARVARAGAGSMKSGLNRVSSSQRALPVHSLQSSFLSTAAVAPITQKEVVSALQTWCDGIVNIGKIFQEKGDYTSASKSFLEEVYGFDVCEGDNKVLFKPTKAAEVPIRHDLNSSLSYFAATGLIKEDGGFAITPFTAIRHEISGMHLLGNTATAMGQYWFTDLSGGETKVEFTFQYLKVPSGKLKIILHHSSLPFKP